MLLKENSLLIKQIENYKKDNELLIKASKVREEQMENCQEINSIYLTEIGKFQKEIKKKNKALLGLKIGGITVSVGLLLLLLFK